MTDEPPDGPHEAMPFGDQCGTRPTGSVARQVATAERIIAHNSGEAVAVDSLIHTLTDELWRLADSGVSISELGAPEKVARVMIRAIHPSSRSVNSRRSATNPPARPDLREP